MPVRRYRSLAEAERELPPSPDASTGVRTALFLARLDFAAQHGIRTTQVGVHRYRTLAEGEAARERYALEQLRRAE